MRFRSLGLVMSLFAVAVIAGCPQAQTTTNIGGAGATVQLTTEEQSALNSALTSAQSLTTGVATAQSTTDFENNQSSATIPGSTTFGTCPEVTLTATSGNNNTSLSNLVLSAALNFGTGCSPFGSTSYFCSGTSTGTYNQTSKQIDLNFAGLTCNGQSVTGTAAVGYEFSTAAVDLDGDWNLTCTDSAGPVTTTGNGTFSFDRTEKSSTISSFDGSVTSGGNTWTAAMTDIQVSYNEFKNFVPFAGDLTLSAGTIRTMTIRFNANSPVNGSIQVSVAGGAFVNTTLDNALSEF